MQEETEQIRKFAEGFFSNLKCQMKWDGRVLNITHVPFEFEQFYGKKAPYSIVFEHGIDENAELVTRGSFLLKTMTSYLDQLGQTSLIKLDFSRDYAEEFKRHLKLRNSELQHITQHADYRYLIRFTFGTTLQYMNEKEQVLNSLFVQDGKVVDFDLEKYKHSEGDEKEVKVGDNKEAYGIAKEKVKSLVEMRIKEAQAMLGARLEREQARIKQHYSNQRQELNRHVTKLNEQLAQLEKSATRDTLYEQKKQRILEGLKQYSDLAIREKLDKEEKFFLQDEVHKHTLNVHNRLVNTSLIYYPIFTFTIYLKGKDVSKSVQVVYDPFEDKLIQNINCETCKREPQQIFVCSSAHIVCNNCFDECRECGKGLCKLCSAKSCESCARKLCKNCVLKCTLCWNDFCKMHMNVNYATGKAACLRCLKRCSVCGAYGDVKHIKKTDKGDICLKCERLRDVDFRLMSH